MDHKRTKPSLSRTLLIVHTVLWTLIVVGTIMRAEHPFYYNPMDTLFSDSQRHFNNAFDVKGDDLASILNAPGFELFLSNLFRLTGTNRVLIADAFAALSAVTPWLWYRWFRELSGDKTMALVGYAAMVFLPSWFRIFGFFMDSTILLPLTGAGLWLTWRAARKGTWKSCLLAAVFSGIACCTKSVALPITVLPWLYVAYKCAARMPKARAYSMAAAGAAIVIAFYGLGPLKVWTHTGAWVLMPDGMYNQRYFESGAHDIEVTNWYNRMDNTTWCAVCIWGSSSVSYPPFHPFSDWMSSRKGRYKMVLDYRSGRDQCKPIHMSLRDRLKYTFENIIFFFFEYQWPEDNDWQDPFPRSIPTLVRFVWLPLTVAIAFWVLAFRRREFVGWYFLVVTLAFMFQQSAVMEGRYKKVWEGLPIGVVLYLAATSKRYKRWRQAQDGDAASDSPQRQLVAKVAAALNDTPEPTQTEQSKTPPAQANPPSETETAT